MSDDPRDNKDDDTTPIKPVSLAGIVLFSAGAGLTAGLLICWLFCGKTDRDEPRQLGLAADSIAWILPV